MTMVYVYSYWEIQKMTISLQQKILISICLRLESIHCYRIIIVIITLLI